MPSHSVEAKAPAQVQRYLDRVLSPGGRVPAEVRVTQAGELRLKPDGRWLRFNARQESSVQEVAFAWRARVRLLPLVWLHVVDRYAAAEGTGEVRLFGRARIAREAGQHVSEGSALRYLAELPWNPHAMIANRYLVWREVDARTVEVATQVSSATVALQLHFDAEGDIDRAWTDARPHKEGGKVVPRPWGGVFSDYEVVGGVGMPTRAEVSWELPDGAFTWFRCKITSLEARP
jgi:hypothetical protein